MKTSTRKLTLSALFLALGLVLLLITGQIPQIGKITFRLTEASEFSLTAQSDLTRAVFVSTRQYISELSNSWDLSRYSKIHLPVFPSAAARVAATLTPKASRITKL